MEQSTGEERRSGPKRVLTSFSWSVLPQEAERLWQLLFFSPHSSAQALGVCERHTHETIRHETTIRSDHHGIVLFLDSWVCGGGRLTRFQNKHSPRSKTRVTRLWALLGTATLPGLNGIVWGIKNQPDWKIYHQNFIRRRRSCCFHPFCLIKPTKPQAHLDKYLWLFISLPISRCGIHSHPRTHTWKNTQVKARSRGMVNLNFLTSCKQTA